MTDAALVVLCTCPDATTARRLADSLIRERLAACANILPGLMSVYEWEGKMEADSEALLLIKTTPEAYAGLEAALAREHPYELPEIIAVPVDRGLEGYLQWVRQLCRPGQ